VTQRPREIWKQKLRIKPRPTWVVCQNNLTCQVRLLHQLSDSNWWLFYRNVHTHSQKYIYFSGIVVRSEKNIKPPNFETIDTPCYLVWYARRRAREYYNFCFCTAGPKQKVNFERCWNRLCEAFTQDETTVVKIKGKKAPRAQHYNTRFNESVIDNNKMWTRLL
jgi:hypothetical protein